MLWPLFAAALLGNSQPAEPAQPIEVSELPNMRIESGAAAALSAKGDGFELIGGRATPVLPAELNMLRQVLEHPEQAMGSNARGVHAQGEATPIVPGTLRFSLVPINGQMLLSIQNGLPNSYVYKARIGRASESQTTDVCQLLPQIRSFEHWPYSFDWIEITEIRRVDFRPGDPPRCG